MKALMNLMKKLKKEQVESMFNMAFTGTSGHLIIIFLTSIIFYQVIKDKIIIFSIFFLIVMTYRYFIIWKYFRAEDRESNIKKWVILYTIGIALTALIWSVGTIYIVKQGIPLHYEYLLFSIIVGIGAAGISTFGMVFFSYIIYVITMLIPYNIFLFYEFDRFHLISGILLLISIPYFIRASYGYSLSFSSLIDRNTKLLNKEKSFSEATLNIVVKVLEEKDLYTVGHAERVSNYCAEFAERLGLSEKDIELLRRSAYLHDIGKIMIPDDILLKKGPLTDNEYETIKLHPQKGYEILKMANNEIINEYLPPIRHHHERYDGLGYPDGLAKEEIPYFARIISIVDTYDAMTSTRSYRNALSAEHAVNEIKRGKGKQFDPDLCDVFLDMIIDRNQDTEKVSEFITELIEEHNEILNFCSTIRDSYQNTEKTYQLLLQIKDKMDNHLKKEDNLLYPPLIKASEKDKEFQESLKFFVNNISQVSKVFNDVIQLFSDGGADENEYKESLDRLAILLNERIKKEESIIFSAFEERVNTISCP
jgi:HD-GYP domain-containing protein (c-di-GMP phosphodiesterase class II)